MGYAENLGTYWRGRYKTGPNRYATVRDESGVVIRFRSKREAKQAADAEEANARKGNWRDPSLRRTTFSIFVSQWYAVQDLAASTMQNYKRHIEEHLLPTFDDVPITDITAADIAKWEKDQRALGYAESSIKTWRATLHLILSDAVDGGLRDSNPATRRRGRGRRTSRVGRRGPEKAVTTVLGLLLIAERAALLSGRDDEFVSVINQGYTGIRWAESVGLETQYVRRTELRVEWQLYELDTGAFHRCPPKDGSRRSIDIPQWHGALLLDHIARTRPTPCACHGLVYTWRGHRAANTTAHRPGPKLVDVARRAGVSTGTVSNVLNRPETVPAATCLKVEDAIRDLGYVRGAPAGELAAHHRRSGFATWLFRPAATGWYPSRAGNGSIPVPILADPWPGVPARGRGATARADACWTPIALRLTNHSLRHVHKTIMDELGTPKVLQDERMGHLDGSVQARYSHVTEPMRRVLVDALTELWHTAVAERLAMSPRSPVAVLDRLLQEAAARQQKLS